MCYPTQFADFPNTDKVKTVVMAADVYVLN